MPPKKFHIDVFGCQMNAREAQWLAAILRRRGFVEAPSDEADILLVNTCSVREKPQRRIEAWLKGLALRPDRMVGVLGCVAQQLGERLFEYREDVRLVAGGASVAAVPDAIEALMRSPNSRVSLLDFPGEHEEAEFDDAPLAQASVSIMRGCDNFCAYCIVPFTRGRQKSRSLDAVLAECAARVRAGALEITLLGQNVNAWGKDRAVSPGFAALLERVASLPGLERLRFVSPHPADMDDATASLFAKCPSLCPRLHLPLQSGSDRVLARMRRRYGAADFLRLADKLRRARPDMAFSADLIVGFPGETEEDFRDTLRLVREVGFVSSYSFAYSDRPGTRASLMPDKISPEIKSERLARLQEAQEDLGRAWLESRVGERTTLLIEGKSPRQGLEKTSWQGRDPYGAPGHVALAGDPSGQLVEVEIVAARKHSLLCRPVGKSGSL